MIIRLTSAKKMTFSVVQKCFEKEGDLNVTTASEAPAALDVGHVEAASHLLLKRWYDNMIRHIFIFES